MQSLSARLLILTALFVMVGEVLIFVPSVARFRLAYLEEKLDSGHLAILTLEASPDRIVSRAVQRQLLAQVGAYAVAVRRPDGARLIIRGDTPPAADASIDLGEARAVRLIVRGLGTMLQTGNRVLRVVGPSPKDPLLAVEVVIDEAPLRQQMIAYAWRILGLSLVISAVTAALVYLSLRWFLVRPLQRISDSMMAFRERPADRSTVIVPSARRDEIGIAERELAEMQNGLVQALRQREHLAALGQAITKINHDLRNILATAQLVGERLANLEEVQVQRLTAPLVKAIDQAIRLCSQTLNFARSDAPALDVTRFNLRDLVEDVLSSLPQAPGSRVTIEDAVDADLVLDADRDQLYRAFANLCRNAVEAGATHVRIGDERRDGSVLVAVSDDGPGIPEKARRHLFEPFTGSTKADGMGLGLAIVREIVRDHGGEVTLESTGPSGTTFMILLPVRQAAPHLAGRPVLG